MSIRILLQTTLLPTEENDWTIARFSLLRDYLASIKDESGNPLFQVTARDREPDSQGNDPILSHLDSQAFDEWLFALDVGGALSSKDLERTLRLAIAAERVSNERGNPLGKLVARSTFHHFVDYNWDISAGCPSFVDEPPSEEIQKELQAVADIQSYVKNLAFWLAPTS